MRGQIVREGRLDVDSLARERMLERKPVRVQELALERLVGDAVDAVADHGEIDRGQVHTDLVRAARLELDSEERVGPKQLGDLEVRDRLAR
jgi:hypothetical protein